MSRLSVYPQKRASRFKEVIFLSEEEGIYRAPGESTSGLRTCIATIVSLLFFGAFYVVYPLVLVPDLHLAYDDSPAARLILLFPILVSFAFSIYFFWNLTVHGRGFFVLRVGHLFFPGNLCLSLFYIAEWLKLSKLLPFEWPIICVPLYVGASFLLVALIWFFVLLRRLSSKKGLNTSRTIFDIYKDIDN